MKKLYLAVSVVVLAMVGYVMVPFFASDKIIEAHFGKVTLTQKACKNEAVVLLTQILGIDASKMKAGALEASDGRGHVELCYLDAKDSPTGRRFVVDEMGGMGNFDPDVAKKK